MGLLSRTGARALVPHCARSACPAAQRDGGGPKAAPVSCVLLRVAQSASVSSFAMCVGNDVSVRLPIAASAVLLFDAVSVSIATTSILWMPLPMSRRDQLN